MKRFGTMFSDVSSSLFRRPATEQYPFVRPVVSERLRGLLQWDPQACTGCGLCAMDCSADALKVTVLDRKAKRFVIAYHFDRCTFCGQCVESCCKGSLRMANDLWELASLDKDSFVIYFGDPKDVEQTLAGQPEGEPEPAGQA